MIINSAADLQQVADAGTSELAGFFTALRDDYITFDDAVYPENYDRSTAEDAPGYVAPITRRVWNAAAALAWGYSSREQIAAELDTINGTNL